MPKVRIRFVRFISILLAILSCALTSTHSFGQGAALPPAPRTKQVHVKHVLVIGQTKGFEHDSISAAMVAVYNMGQESGLWDATLRTDTELLTKKDLGRNAKNLNYFDLIVFTSTTGELDMDADQKRDMLSFVHDDGKGFVGIHAALDTNYNWPEYGEMIGGWFDQHPWMTFNAPIINEAPDFPAVSHFPRAFVKYDEIYQPKAWSRDKVNVLLSLDPGRLDYSNNPARPSHGPRLRGGVEQDVRQGASFLFNAGAYGRVLERPGHSQNVLRSDPLGIRHDRRKYGFTPQARCQCDSMSHQ